MATGAEVLRSDPGPAPGTPPDAQSEGDWQLLPAATLRAWHVDNVLGLLAVCVVLGCLATLGRPLILQPWLLPLAGLAVLAAVVESALVLPRRHRCYRYRLGAGSVEVESGALVLRQLVVPLHQVLYVETHQGPVLRAFGLTRVRLGTIADPKSVGPLATGAAQLLCRAVETSRNPAAEQEGR